MSRIVCGIGIIILLMSVLIALAGVGMMYSMESDDAELSVNTDDGTVTQFAGCQFYIFNDDIFIGLGVVLASLPVSILGLALINMGSSMGIRKEMKLGYSHQKYICDERNP